VQSFGKGVSVVNSILSRLSPSDFGAASGEPKFRQRLEAASRRIKSIYFIEAGLASVIAIGGARAGEAEICVVGREGMTGIAGPLGHGTFGHGDAYAG
jgi:hypothetical protein